MAYICSRYYRSPELIFGNTDYDSSIDIWSLGCVLAEAFFGKPLFQGESTVDQLLQIFRILGTPGPEQLNDLNKNGTFSLQFPPSQPVTINKVFNGKGKELVKLLYDIFSYEPNKRPSALEVLAHPFFDELRLIDSMNNGKYIVPQLFDFSDVELNLYNNQKSILKKIVPEWSETYKNLI